MGALEQFLEEFTYAGIFLALFLGGIGVPLPEENAFAHTHALRQHMKGESHRQVRLQDDIPDHRGYRRLD